MPNKKKALDSAEAWNSKIYFASQLETLNVDITEAEWAKYILDSCDYKATGPDGFPAELFNKL